MQAMQAVDGGMSAASAVGLADELASGAAAAARELRSVYRQLKDDWLLASAQRLRAEQRTLLEANQRDLDAAPQFGLSAAGIDRLRLDPTLIEAMAGGLQQIAALPDPVGELIEGYRRPNGLEVWRQRVPLGVIFFIYESRPNVTVDAAAICIKSGNAVILRGGKEALHSSAALLHILQAAADEVGLPKGAFQLVPTADRQVMGALLERADQIDLTIPRGGRGLIEYVTQRARMPVLKHYDGNCHMYVDRAADLRLAVTLVTNAKCQRMGVCNACESLLVHRDVAAEFLPSLEAALAPYRIELRGDELAGRYLQACLPACEQDWRQEYLGPILSVRVVDNLEEAILHIAKYGSGHTDAIVTTDLAAARHFVQLVDSSAVMVNTSTRFNDGEQLGLGAEIGISTDRLHARGPCGLRELTTYKYVVWGDGQIRI
jgi:glutamate-5-semialdehyde dehydrogenase